jgi:hypothetical protein
MMTGFCTCAEKIDLSRSATTTHDRGGSARIFSGPFKCDVDVKSEKEVLPDTGPSGPAVQAGLIRTGKLYCAISGEHHWKTSKII